MVFLLEPLRLHSKEVATTVFGVENDRQKANGRLQPTRESAPRAAEPGRWAASDTH